MVKVKILDGRGHALLELGPEEALHELKAREGRWVFVDGEYTPCRELSVERLRGALEVVVTYPLQGG